MDPIQILSKLYPRINNAPSNSNIPFNNNIPFNSNLPFNSDITFNSNNLFDSIIPFNSNAIFNSNTPFYSGTLFNSSGTTETDISPPSGLLAVVVHDLITALVTFGSMVTQHGLYFGIDPAPDDPFLAMKQHVRMNTPRVQQFAGLLELKVDEALGPPGTKSEEELRAIRKSIGDEFTVLGRVLTAEVWQWIRMMASAGFVEMA